MAPMQLHQIRLKCYNESTSGGIEISRKGSKRRAQAKPEQLVTRVEHQIQSRSATIRTLQGKARMMSQDRQQNWETQSWTSGFGHIVELLSDRKPLYLIHIFSNAFIWNDPADKMKECGCKL